MEYLESCGAKVEAFVRSSDQFQDSCTNAFNVVDDGGYGRVGIDQVAAAAVVFFKDVAGAVDDFGIKVKQPSPEEIKKILLDSGYKEGQSVNRTQFEELYVAILKYAAVKCAVGFAQKYGLGIAVGFTALVILKRAVRAVPIVGPVAKPLLGLFPAPLFGPLLGVLGVFIADRGDLTDVKRKLFDKPEHKGQFKSG